MMYKSFLLLATASTLALSACAGDSGSTSMAASTASAPAHAAMTAPAAPGALTTTVQPTNTMPGTLPPATDLLNAPMSTVSKTPDVETRLTRLETDVEVMKGQIQLVRPILEKMPALQDKLSELVTELQRIDARVAATKSNADMMPEVKSGKEPSSEKPLKTGSSPTASVPSPMQKPAPKMAPIISPIPKKPDAPTTTHSEQKEAAKSAYAAPTSSPEMAATPSSTTPSAKGLMAVRVGEDMEKTRVVLDVGSPAAFQYDLDNAEKIMIIDLNTPVASAGMGEFDKSPLIASYSTQSIAPDKSRVILQLRTPVNVLKTSTLPPNGDKPDRVILDLVPAAR